MVRKIGSSCDMKMSDFKVTDLDTFGMDKETEKIAKKFKGKGKLYAMNGFYIFKLDRSVKIIGDRHSFEKPTLRMRTHDACKIEKRLRKHNGGYMPEVHLYSKGRATNGRK